MSREVSIIVAVKNAMQVGLASTKKSINDFGSGMADLGKKIGMLFIGAGTAIAGFALKALSAFSESEAATRALQGAFMAYGDEIPINTERVKQFAQQIENETGVSQENIVSTAARLRMLGVEAGGLEQATKATIALKSAGIEEEKAARIVAMAHAGNFTALSRYIPALKMATTEADKARIVNDFLARGYIQQKNNLNTVQGQYGLMKERMHDVWVEIGKQIAGNGALSGILKQVGDAIKSVGEKIAAWAKSGGMSEFMSTMKLGFEDLRFHIASFISDFSVGWAAISAGCVNAFQYITGLVAASINVWSEEWTYFKNLAIAVWEAIKHPIEKGFEAPSTAALHQALDDVVTAYKDTNDTISQGEQDALKAREDMVVDHNLRVQEIETQRTAAAAKEVDQRVADEKIALAASVANNQTAADGIAQVSKTLTEKLAAEDQKRVDSAKAAAEKLVAKASDTIDKISASAEKNGNPASSYYKGSKTATTGGWGGESGNWTIGVNKMALTGPGTNSQSLTGYNSANGFGMNASLSSLSSFSGGSLYTGDWGGGQTSADILNELKKMNQNQSTLLKLR